MPEQITVEVFVKPYVAKYLNKNYGNPINLYKNKTLRNCFRKYLIKPSYHNDKTFERRFKYNDRKAIYIIITEYEFYRYGWEISMTDQINFNSLVEGIIKQRLFDHLLLLPEKIITKKINKIREKFNFTEDDLSYDAIKKDFYRFRINNNLGLQCPQNNQQL